MERNAPRARRHESLLRLMTSTTAQHDGMQDYNSADVQYKQYDHLPMSLATFISSIPYVLKASPATEYLAILQGHEDSAKTFLLHLLTLGPIQLERSQYLRSSAHLQCLPAAA
jgi:hypothetical protein